MFRKCIQILESITEKSFTDFYLRFFLTSPYFHFSRNNMLKMFKGDKSFIPECFRASQFMVVSCAMYINVFQLSGFFASLYLSWMRSIKVFILK